MDPSTQVTAFHVAPRDLMQAAAATQRALPGALAFTRSLGRLRFRAVLNGLDTPD